MDSPGQGLRHILRKNMCNRSFITPNEKSFGQKNFSNRCVGTKVPKWLFGKKQPLCQLGTFVPVHRFQKFFWPNDFFLIVVKDVLPTSAKKVSLALSRAVHVLIREDKLNYFKFLSVNFKNSFCFGQLGSFWKPQMQIRQGPILLCFNFVSRQCAE